MVINNNLICKTITHQASIQEISDFLTQVYFSDYDNEGSCKTKVFKSFFIFCGLDACSMTNIPVITDD